MNTRSTAAIVWRYCPTCSGSVHLSIYSPPFAAGHVAVVPLHVKRARPLKQHHLCRVLSTTGTSWRGCAGHDAWAHVVRSLHGHADGNCGGDALRDFPGDIIRLHAEHGLDYMARYHVWKEPLAVRNRLMKKDLAHRTIVEDSTRCCVASADYLLTFRKRGENPVPVAHPVGLSEYAGARKVPEELERYRGWTGNQIENRYSHWIWRQYAARFGMT